MDNRWREEFWRGAGLLFAGALFGWLIGSIALGILLVLVVYLGWHLINLNRLVRWLREGKKFQPPEAGGIWDEAFEHLFRLQQRNRKRKRDLRRLLKRFHKITMALPDAAVELRPGSEEIEWWNSAAGQYLGFRYPRDVGQRISNILRHPAFLEHLHSGDYEHSVEIPSPVNEDISLRLRIISYGGNRRLLIARDMTRLQNLERTRKDFVANVSHELRTPLTVISGYLESLVSEDEIRQETRDQLRSMQIQAQRMNRIVDDLMLLSRLESDLPKNDAEPIAVARLLDMIVDQARHLSGLDEHVIELDVDPHLLLRGRESELYSAFSNLVFNAIRYTPPGGHIIIRWKLLDDVPVFSVEDTGPGIAPQHIPRLTERFYRVDAGRSSARGGTGLGLAIVKHVLLRHDAYLEIESDMGRGSVFRCCFSAPRALRVDPEAMSVGPADVAAS
ncbi:MAG: phosphate regulon sensor histidine kinase PhoR [Thiogranum sp.]|nr:phosphate regulon sensor histidine kinase PhoR [Thiogranum sp.]